MPPKRKLHEQVAEVAAAATKTPGKKKKSKKSSKKTGNASTPSTAASATTGKRKQLLSQRPLTILVCGTPAVGKSTFCNKLAQKMNASAEQRPVADHLEVSDIVKKHKLYSEWDDVNNCSIFDDDMVRDYIGARIAGKAGKKALQAVVRKPLSKQNRERHERDYGSDGADCGSSSDFDSDASDSDPDFSSDEEDAADDVSSEAAIVSARQLAKAGRSPKKSGAASSSDLDFSSDDMSAEIASCDEMDVDERERFGGKKRKGVVAAVEAESDPVAAARKQLRRNLLGAGAAASSSSGPSSPRDAGVRGAYIVDFHCADIFEGFRFDVIVVLRCLNTSLLATRMEARKDPETGKGYSEDKIRGNLECEIFQSVLEEAHETFETDIEQKKTVMLELNNEAEADFEGNLERVSEALLEKLSAGSAV